MQSTVNTDTATGKTVATDKDFSTAILAATAANAASQMVPHFPLFLFGLNGYRTIIGNAGQMDEAQLMAAESFKRWHDAQADPDDQKDLAGTNRLLAMLGKHSICKPVTMEEARAEVGDANAFQYRQYANTFLEIHDYFSRAFVFTGHKPKQLAEYEKTSVKDFDAWMVLHSTVDGELMSGDADRDTHDARAEPELYAAVDAVKAWIMVKRARAMETTGEGGSAAE